MSSSKEVKHIREVLVKEIIKYFIIPLILLIIIWTIFLINKAIKFIPIPYIVFLIINIVITYILLRMLALGTILMYKAFAPMSIRDRCLFEPSCSTYMLLAIKKYGLIIGIIKGIKRILRCKPPNGGVDWP